MFSQDQVCKLKQHSKELSIAKQKINKTKGTLVHERGEEIENF